MGSYDTGECSVTPEPRRSSPRRSTPRREEPAPNPVRRVPPPEEETTEYSSVDEQAADAIEHYVPAAGYDPTLKTIVALGGGLTPDRIVQPVPEDVRDGSLLDVVKYLMSDDIATRSEDRAIVEAVQERMTKDDYRVIINDSLNFHNRRMSKPLIQYLVPREQQGEDGPLKYNFADIAVVSHEEGGMPYQRQLPLEHILYR